MFGANPWLEEWCNVLVLWRRHGFSFILPLVAGGVAYTLGAVVLGLNWPVLVPGVIGPRELWHAAVLAGLALHWQFVSQIASGDVSSTTEPAISFVRRRSRQYFAAVILAPGSAMHG